MTIRLYSTTPADNDSAPPNGWPEGQAASTINDCGRQMQADIRESFEELPYFDFGDTPTRVDNDTFTVAGDLTARYVVGYRVKLVGATTGFGRISVSSFGAGVTTIDVVMDSGNVPASLVRVAVNNNVVSFANPSASIGLSAVNGTATTSMRSDAAPASQSITPTMTGKWTFTQARGASQATAIMASSSFPFIMLDQSNAAANNRYWDFGILSEQLIFRILNDADNSSSNWLTVDRTGTTVDRVAFPSDNNASAFSVGAAPTTTGAMAHISTATGSAAALTIKSATAATSTGFVWNTATAGDNIFLQFLTEGSSGTSRGSIDFNRAGTAVRYNTSSDGRLKRNVLPAPSAVNLVLSLPVDSFDWIEGDVHVEHGFVAQKLYEVFPDAVSGGTDPEAIMGIDRGALVPVLCKALQETIQQVRALEQRVAVIEAPGSIRPR
jgi:hypothetical protein